MSNEVPRLSSCVQLQLSEYELRELVQKAKDWALMHGAAMRSKDNFNEDSLQFAPFALLPSIIPRREFKHVVDIQIIFNELIHKIAHNTVFLTNCLKGVTDVDEFTANLFKIFETVQKEGVSQPVSLGLVRCDYMLESSPQGQHNSLGIPPFSWKQVEFNTIASGFGWMGPISADIQRFVLQELGHSDKLQNLPDNDALSGLCQGMLEAWKLYGDPESVILFLVEDVSYNICDQRFHEFKIRKLNPNVRVIRKTLTQVARYGVLTTNKELKICDDIVSVIYFRAGYEPGQYHSKKEWDARLMIERSRAIKSPSIHYHLAGTKKVQQELTKPGVVELFLSDSDKVAAVRDVFVGLYSLDNDETGNRAVQMAISDPERFVLKPQREGGGNNIYGLEVSEALLRMKDSKERTAWILMDRIFPPIANGYIIRPGGPKLPLLNDMVSELGIFGVVIGDSQEIYTNKQVGHMLRTKDATANEGGVASGLGALDSPYLFD